MVRGNKPVRKGTKWDPLMITMVFHFALLGVTDKELAVAFNVSVDRISVWKRTQPQFRDAYSKGKAEADAKVAYSLYQNAVGYDYHEQQVVRIAAGYEEVNGEMVKMAGRVELMEVRKHHAAESWAAAKWLELRRSNDWSVTQKFEVKNINTNVNIDYAKLSTEQLHVLETLAIANTKKLT